MKYSEKWGDSIDIAVELALLDLKLTRDQVQITVLEEPSKGFFGIGSKLAKVRVEEKEEEKPAKKPERSDAASKPSIAGTAAKAMAAGRDKDRPKRTESIKEIKHEGDREILIEVCGVDEPATTHSGAIKIKKDSARRDKRRRAPATKREFSYGEAKVLNERPADLVEAEQHVAKLFLTDVTREMGLEVSIKVFANNDSVYIDIDGKDSGTIIGKRGQTLDAMQYLTSLVVNKDKSDYIRVVIDAEGYREKREVTLEKLANRLADKAVKSRRSVRLEPMNPYERKVIHTALQSRPEVTTKSEGEEPYRRVIIEPLR